MLWLRLSCLTLLVVLCLQTTDADEGKGNPRPVGAKANAGKKLAQATPRKVQNKLPSGASRQKAKGQGRISLAPRTTTTTAGPTTLKRISLSPRTVPVTVTPQGDCDPCTGIGAPTSPTEPCVKDCVACSFNPGATCAP
ncbi:hypothetical protein RvY_06680 [Ramazzottius varieornatus]|uniref:Uncharacterized protein n=1 Tax=Ramazzottius varieornatus TaxID=947166 RepID=A0A1D1V8Z2_RAMVA|nr:hypothetical protein RvY_06680 [Ramazzottius varieornatus]